MDNVVQNIELNKIIPPKESIIINNDIENLVDSIRKYGILEPILLKPINGQYKIIIGKKRYEIARLLGFPTIPALIKDLDEDIIKQYNILNDYASHQENYSQQQQKFINLPSQQSDKNNYPQIKDLSSKKIQSTPKKDNTSLENKFIEKDMGNRDIINLSELNKIEYERDDFNMNNNMPNNNGENYQNTNSMPQEPTFGGRFFPSLEDEPTNMNMGTVNIPTSNNFNEVQHNNLIDLTDAGTNGMPQAQNLSNNGNFNSTTATPPQNSTVASQFEIGKQQDQFNPIPSPTDNILNINNLQNNNQPISQQPQSAIPQSLSDIQSQPNYQPQFDMSKNISPVVMNQPQENLQPTAPTISQENQQNLPNDLSANIPVYNPENLSPIQVNETPSINNTQPSPIIEQKDLTPVLNIIKNVAFNLEPFGYKININEENLENSVKLTIEIEK